MAALERPLARVPPRVLCGRSLRGEAPPAPLALVGAGEGLLALVRPEVNHKVVSNAERRGTVRARRVGEEITGQLQYIVYRNRI